MISYRKSSTKIFQSSTRPSRGDQNEKIPLAKRISFKNPSTDELSTYIVASHGFIIGLRCLQLIFLNRTRDFQSELSTNKASARTRGAVDAIKCENRPLANRISFESPMRGRKISSGLPGASRANGWAWRVENGTIRRAM